MRKLRACGVLVVRGNPIEQFLLMVHPDRLDLPKGHTERGESDTECALRELEEETSITADDVELDQEFRFTTSYRVWPEKLGREECDKTLVVFLGRLKRDVSIKTTEHESYRWVTWSPPHRIQQLTIDPLLAELETHLSRSRGKL